ncbi:PhzF family phenazine biosynthesis protein [Paractinoplanes brasiliensis]|uniref:Trans-2,3-dihydro-3-hydroxyanthranilate isomerase n=1 Tax=Paractinoplanes brasiliensis TaxID=52695 RepID=A0A4R6JWS3_9ACTN|nr:PhzF family phenazine biosynthesis protein [Actinoplanes brasiliensis]TDO40101.1 trans-2,3-dihydro-3-hydroxyanthranilate isomerase [Actinoplanes brasiliensis]GID25166.1 phenazine antibiotic biosynthesis-like protein [Actinoplanes brasiliensis]
MSGVAYEIVDVFTDRPFAGNPLAVVHDADHLATDQMQTLAREFNLAETVFVMPPDDPSATYRARIFTPEGELPFAGHPTVGAAVTSMRRGLFSPGQVVQECGAGLLPITVSATGSATVTGGTPQLGPPLDPAGLLAIAGLTPDDFAGSPPRSAGCGLDWIFLPVRREALAAVEIDTPAARRAGLTELSVFAWSSSTSQAHARVFCPGAAVPEDPATGSAALGLGVWLVDAGWLPADGTAAYRVHQGIEMKRPSLLDCTVTAAEGVATRATVAGHVVPIAGGTIIVPPFIG